MEIYFKLDMWAPFSFQTSFVSMILSYYVLFISKRYHRLQTLSSDEYWCVGVNTRRLLRRILQPLRTQPLTKRRRQKLLQIVCIKFYLSTTQSLMRFLSLLFFGCLVIVLFPIFLDPGTWAGVK